MTTILVVDDLADMRHALRRQLASHAEVVLAANAEEALAILERVEVGIILSDYRMPPSRDGVALLLEVQRRWPKTRRLLMSGEDVPGMTDLIASGLVEQFFAKPMDFAAISTVLTTARPG